MRIYLEQAQRVSRAPKGGVLIYSAGHYNVEDDFARTWIKSGAAFPVDKDDQPIRDPKLRSSAFTFRTQVREPDEKED